MARVLSSVHVICTTCSLCWTSLCAPCLYIITRPDSQFLCTCVYILCDFLWPEVQPHSDDSQTHVSAPVLCVYSVRLAPQCRAFSSTYIVSALLKDVVFLFHSVLDFRLLLLTRQVWTTQLKSISPLQTWWVHWLILGPCVLPYSVGFQLGFVGLMAWHILQV